MSWMRGVWERVREATGRRRFEAEMDEEMRYHLEREVERLVAGGLDAEAARREARRRFGEVGRVKEEAREGSGLPWLEAPLRDARHALRGLRRSPGFAVSAVLTLGLGIGATTAIFSVVDGVLLEPLPYPDPDRLVRVFEQNSPDNRWNLSLADVLAIEERQDVFDGVAAIQVAGAAFTGRGRPERITVARVTADWFRVLGVEPLEGRSFRAGEDRPGAEPVVVLSAGFRDRVFGEGRDVLGRSVTLDGLTHTVVGVLAPDRETLAGREADAWPILTLEPPARRGPFNVQGLARLGADRTLEDARLELDRISREIFPLWADTFRDAQARMTPLPLVEVMLGSVRPALWMLLAAVGGVLLIAVANVANLFLVRAAGRESEMALRASLGAGRGRLAGQLLVESLVVSLLGGALGVALAAVGLEALVAAGPALPRLGEVGLDGSVLALSAAVSAGAALAFGLAPLARLALGGGAPGALRTSSGGGKGWNRLRGALVTAEFAIAFTLTTGAALLVVSFLRLQRVDPGYEQVQRVALEIALPSAGYPGYPEVTAFWDELLLRARAIPGVLEVGVAAALPPGGAGSAGTNNFDLLDKPVADGESEPQALWNSASPGFFTALGVPLLEGRLYEERDRTDQSRVVVVSESWARRYYPEGSALGARLYAGGDRSGAMTVVGVVGDVKYMGLGAGEEWDASVYEPSWQGTLRTGHLVVRSRGPLDATVEAVRGLLAGHDAELPLAGVQTMEERTRTTLARPRQWTTFLGTFAAVGLLLAAVGAYGVLAHHVSAQRREIAIRVALGAQPGAVRRLVVLRGMSLAGLGIALGAGATLWLVGGLRSLVFGVSPHDPGTLALVAALLGGVALLASALPARNAGRIDPMGALKGD